jgi:hypothetical protein
MIQQLCEATRALAAGGNRPTEDVVEITLLLSGQQVSALENAAHDRGLTAAELVRGLLRDFLLSETTGHELEANPEYGLDDLP